MLTKKIAIIFAVVTCSAGSCQCFPGEENEVPAEYYVSPELAVAAGLARIYTQGITELDTKIPFSSAKPVEPFIVEGDRKGREYYCCIYYYGEGEPPADYGEILRQIETPTKKEIMRKKYLREHGGSFTEDEEFLGYYNSRVGIKYFHCFVPTDKRGGQPNTHWGFPRFISEYYLIDEIVEGETGCSEFEKTGFMTTTGVNFIKVRFDGRDYVVVAAMPNDCEVLPIEYITSREVYGMTYDEDPCVERSLEWWAGFEPYADDVEGYIDDYFSK